MHAIYLLRDDQTVAGKHALVRDHAVGPATQSFVIEVGPSPSSMRQRQPKLSSWLDRPFDVSEALRIASNSEPRPNRSLVRQDARDGEAGIFATSEWHHR